MCVLNKSGCWWVKEWTDGIWEEGCTFLCVIVLIVLFDCCCFECYQMTLRAFTSEPQSSSQM